jgi:hypothetical protein
MASTTLSTSLGLMKCVMPKRRAISCSRRVDVHADDLVGAHHLRALDHVQAYAAQPEHHHVGAGFDLGREKITAPTPVVTPQPM